MEKKRGREGGKVGEKEREGERYRERDCLTRQPPPPLPALLSHFNTNAMTFILTVSGRRPLFPFIFILGVDIL